MRELKVRIFEKMRKAAKVVTSLMSLPVDFILAIELENTSCQIQNLTTKISEMVAASTLDDEPKSVISAWITTLTESI
jgi:hypothetical protein